MQDTCHQNTLPTMVLTTIICVQSQAKNQLTHEVYTKDQIKAWLSSRPPSTLQMKMDWYSNCCTCTASTEVTKCILRLSHYQRACFCTLLTRRPLGFKTQWAQQGCFGEWEVLNRLSSNFTMILYNYAPLLLATSHLVLQKMPYKGPKWSAIP